MGRVSRGDVGMTTSWQTTVAGIACISGGVYLIASGKSVVEGGGLIAAGIGLVRAKDANVVSTLDQVQDATRDADRKALAKANEA